MKKFQWRNDEEMKRHKSIARPVIEKVHLGHYR